MCLKGYPGEAGLEENKKETHRPERNCQESNSHLETVGRNLKTYDISNDRLC